MKKLLFIAAILTIHFSATAQVPVKLKKVMSFIMPRTIPPGADLVDGPVDPGTRGASVVWHPVQKKYYAAMAGNARFPLGVYDATGKKLSEDELSCDADTRGLWYNPQQSQIQGNAYNDGGWFGYKLNAKGIPVEATVLLDGMNQPDEQSVGAYYPAKQQVIFLFNRNVSFYTKDGVLDNALTINWGRTKTQGKDEDMEGVDEATPEEYNYTTVLFTGIKGSELGFLNTVTKQIELYNMADGFLVKKLALPDDQEVYANFNFSYTNGMYWFFNIDTRTWTAYK